MPDLREKIKQPLVIIEIDKDHTGNLPRDKEFKNLFEELAKKLNKNIKLHFLHSRYHHFPIDDNLVHIFPLCASTGVYSFERLERIFGIKNLGRGNTPWLITPESLEELSGGIELKDDEGSTYGEIRGMNGLNNLYLWFDAFNYWGKYSESEELLKKVLEEYCAIVADTKKVESITKAMREDEEKIINESASKYVVTCARRIIGEREELTTAIKEKNEKLKELSEEMAQITKGLYLFESRLKDLDVNNGEDTLKEDYKKLLEHPAVEKVIAREHKVEIFTSELIIKEAKSEIRRKVGRFKIEFHFNSGKFVCYNIGGYFTTVQHPHIGSPYQDYCLAHSDEIRRLIGKYQINTAFFLLWNQLNKYSEGHERIEINNLPIAEEAAA